MIAMALSMQPQLLIADEPTTALDVTIQAQILELLRELRDRVGTAILLISHDLGVVNELADRIAVMYAGRLSRRASARSCWRGRATPIRRACSLRCRRGRGRASRWPRSPARCRRPAPGRPAAASTRAAPAVFERCRHEVPGPTPTSPSQRAFCHAVELEEASA